MVFPDFAVPERIWSSYETFIFDADGVLWLGTEPVPRAAELLSLLLAAGKRVLVLTNNSTKSASQYVEKLGKLGFRGLTKRNIVGAGMVAARELALGGLRKMKRTATAAGDSRGSLPVYLFGSTGLEAMLAEEGVESFGAGPDTVEQYMRQGETFLMDVDTSKRVFAVVSSFDSHISYVKIMKAVNHLKDPNVHFVATNEDLTFPGSVPGVIVPGAGAVSCVLRAISGRQPTVMGKPHKPTFDFIADRLGDAFDTTKTLMIGDRMDTDIRFGNSNSLDTLLVMTGVSRFEDLDKLESELEEASPSKAVDVADGRAQMMPRYWANSVADLLLTQSNGETNVIERN